MDTPRACVAVTLVQADSKLDARHVGAAHCRHLLMHCADHAGCRGGAVFAGRLLSVSVIGTTFTNNLVALDVSSGGALCLKGPGSMQRALGFRLGYVGVLPSAQPSDIYCSRNVSLRSPPSIEAEGICRCICISALSIPHDQVMLRTRRTLSCGKFLSILSSLMSPRIDSRQKFRAEGWMVLKQMMVL